MEVDAVWWNPSPLFLCFLLHVSPFFPMFFFLVVHLHLSLLFVWWDCSCRVRVEEKQSTPILPLRYFAINITGGIAKLSKHAHTYIYTHISHNKPRFIVDRRREFFPLLHTRTMKISYVIIIRQTINRNRICMCIRSNPFFRLSHTHSRHWHRSFVATRFILFI